MSTILNRSAATFSGRWRGRTCVIFASGPSLAAAQAGHVCKAHKKGRAKVITINRSWEMTPWADVLYACDAKFWRAYDGVPGFAGMKVSQDGAACAEYPDIYRVVIPDGRVDEMYRDPRFVGNGKNSGFQALNLAVHFGAARILLLGFDFRFDRGRKHWFGSHERGLNNPSESAFPNYCRYFARAAPQLKEWGVEVINCSPGSALDCFPKADIREVL